jgi:uncharacterized protein (DUF1330 family)
MLKETLEYFEEIRNEAKVEAVAIEQFLIDSKDWLENFDAYVKEEINAFLEKLSLNLDDLQASIEGSDLYTTFRNVIINFPEVAKIFDTDNSQEFTSLMQGLESMMQAILEDSDLGSLVIREVNSMATIALEPAPDYEEPLHQYLLRKQGQLERMLPHMSTLISLFLPTDIYEPTGVVADVITKVDDLGDLLTAVPSDTYKEGTLYIAGRKFAVDTSSQEILTDHNPSVAYILGATPSVSISGSTLTITLGDDEHPTTAAQLKTALTALEVGDDTAIASVNLQDADDTTPLQQTDSITDAYDSSTQTLSIGGVSIILEWTSSAPAIDTVEVTYTATSLAAPTLSINDVEALTDPGVLTLQLGALGNPTTVAQLITLFSTQGITIGFADTISFNDEQVTGYTNNDHNDNGVLTIAGHPFEISPSSAFQDHTPEVFYDLVVPNVRIDTNSDGNRAFTIELGQAGSETTVGELRSRLEADDSISSVTASNPEMETKLMVVDESEHSYDSETHTLVIAGEEFVLTLEDGQSLSSDPPTVSYPHERGAKPEVTVTGTGDDRILTIHLGASNSKTTVSQLEDVLKEYSEITAVTYTAPLIPTTPRLDFEAAKTFVTTKYTSLNNNLGDLDTHIDLPPVLENAKNQVLSGFTAAEGFLDGVDVSGAVEPLATFLKEKIANYDPLINSAKDYLLELLNDEHLLEGTMVNKLARFLRRGFPDYKDTIIFWESFVSDIELMDTTEGFFAALITVVEDHYIHGKTVTIRVDDMDEHHAIKGEAIIGGVDLIRPILNVLQLLKFLEENEIAVSIKEYPEVSAEPQPEVAEGTVLDNSPSSTPPVGSATEQTQSSAGGGSQGSPQVEIDFSDLSSEMLRSYLSPSIISALPESLQPIAIHLGEGSLEDYFMGALDTENLSQQIEASMDAYRAIFNPFSAVLTDAVNAGDTQLIVDKEVVPTVLRNRLVQIGDEILQVIEVIPATGTSTLTLSAAIANAHLEGTSVSLFKTTVSTAIDAAETSITLTSTVSIGVGDYLLLDREILQVESVDTDTHTLTVSRGQQTSTPASHDAGSLIIPSTTTLSTPVADDVTTSISVDSAQDIMANNYLVVENEVLRVESVDTYTHTLTVLRGQKGTTASAHPGSNVKVFNEQADYPSLGAISDATMVLIRSLTRILTEQLLGNQMALFGASLTTEITPDAPELTIDKEIVPATLNSPNEFIQIGSEILEVTQVVSANGTSTLTVTRGQQDSTPSSHDRGASVTLFKTKTAAVMDDTESYLVVQSAASIAVHSYIQIEDEILQVTAVDLESHTLTVLRGRNGSTASNHPTNCDVSEASNMGIVQRTSKILFGFPALVIHMLLHHVSLPKWLVTTLMGEQDQSDGATPIHPVSLLLTMPYAGVKKVFEISETKLYEEPQEA